MPINKLRNIAQDNCVTEYILMLDVDFAPDRHLETRVNQYIAQGFFSSFKVQNEQQQVLRGRYLMQKYYSLISEVNSMHLGLEMTGLK